MIDGETLMSSREHGSEEMMARLTCRALRGTPAPRILIGGLGLGYTLRAALDKLPQDADVVVGEMSPAVVKWNRGPLAHLAENPLADARVTVEEDDISNTMRQSPESFDAILLDVDNGPEAFTHYANHGLYELSGLATVRRALKDDGILAVWSAFEAPSFRRRLRRAGFSVEVKHFPSRQSRPHTIYLARRESGAGD